MQRCKSAEERLHKRRRGPSKPKRYSELTPLAMILLIIGLIAVQSHAQSAAPTEVVRAPSMQVRGVDEITPYYRRLLQYHMRFDPLIAEEQVLFIGDSLVQGQCVVCIVPGAVNLGIGGDTTYGVLGRLQVCGSCKRVRGVVLAVGLNDFKFRSEKAIVANYRRILDALGDVQALLVSAILPLDEEIRTDRLSINTRIASVNAGLSSLCSGIGHCVFVDAGAALADENGNLADRYHVGDGTHLNAEGNRVWGAAIRAGIARWETIAHSSAD